MVFDQAKDFSCENGPNLLFQIQKYSKLSKSHDNFFKIATNVEQVYFFYLHIYYVTKLGKIISWMTIILITSQNLLKKIICLNICLKKKKDLTSIP